MRRLRGELTVTLSDGYVEHAHIRERHREKFVDRIQENLKIILGSGPPGHVKINYRGDLAAEMYDVIKKAERERNGEKE